MKLKVLHSGLASLLGAALASGLALAQESSTHPGNLPQAMQAEGVPIDEVSVTLRKSSGSKAEDEAALAAVRMLAAELAAEPFSAITLRRVMERMERETGVGRVEYRLLPQGATALRIQFLVDTTPAEGAGKVLREGVLTGDFADFPLLYKDDRSLFTAIVAGGIGAYSDGHAWFGKPQSFLGSAGYLPGSRTSWTEGSVELGGGFATQLGATPLYAYGALSGMKTWTLGSDIFRENDRDFDAIEKAYAGVLYAESGSPDRVKLGVGRQTFTLNDGFLVNLVKGSVNAGDRGASYLGPRLANEFSVLADGRVGRWGFHAFYIDPSELAAANTRTTFLGANLKHRFNDDLSFDGTALRIPSSETLVRAADGHTVDREGLNTAAGHLLWKNLGVDGVFLEGEFAHQWHPDEDVSAWAGYGTIGYIARRAPWTPSISYRHAWFSGDDPETAAFERWDPLLSTGLGMWLQGISFGKIASNSNLATHRIQLNVAPLETVNVTFDYHQLRVPEAGDGNANRVPGALSSSDLGQEFTLSARWAIHRNLFLQAVASYAVPGQALEDIGANRDWSTLQLSLYWGL